MAGDADIYELGEVTLKRVWMNKIAFTELRIFLISIILTVFIFAIDSLTPSGYAASFLYILPVFICLWAPKDRMINWMALIVTILTIVAVPLQPPQDPFAELFNRPIAIAGIWIVALLGQQRRKSERVTEQYAQDLARSNAELQQFAYVASHDLQEPLRMVIGYLTLLERKYQDKLGPEGKEFIHYAVDGGKRMHDLINNLLDYSRVNNSGKVFVPVDMKDVVSEVRQEFGAEDSAHYVEGAYR